MTVAARIARATDGFRGGFAGGGGVVIAGELTIDLAPTDIVIELEDKITIDVGPSAIEIDLVPNQITIELASEIEVDIAPTDIEVDVDI